MNNKIIIATVILFALITLSCISAADNNETAKLLSQDNNMNADEIVAQDNDINIEKKLTNEETEVSDFSTLNTEIANSTTDTIKLTKNYTYNSKNDSNYTNGIVIDKADFTVDGQGRAIDGAELARIFNIAANNITLKNINFMNGCSKSGGAIICNYGNLTITNCNFTNNNLIEDEGCGGAISFDGDSLTIKNSKFIGNTAIDGGESGAIFFDGNTLNIIQSEFIDNSANNEAVMLAIGETVTIFKSKFENNEAESGVIHISAVNSLIDECKFINNYAERYVGLSNSDGTMRINNTYFANNKAERSTRLIRNSISSTAIISNCVFENNIGNEGNYTIDNNYGTIYLYNNTINTQSSEIHNYGGNITSPCTAIALENKTFPVTAGQKTTLTATIVDDNGNLIEEAYHVYFKINNELIESEYNQKTSKYEAEYTFKTIGSVPIGIVCPSINITVKQGICNVSHHSYVDLVNEINSCQGNIFELSNDYIYDYLNDSSYTNGSVINKSDFTIDGNGHSINGAGLARIFNITANNITLKNINFINGNADFGAAIYCKDINLKIIGCKFSNNIVSSSGGAIFFDGYDLLIADSKFISNEAYDYGAVDVKSITAEIRNTEFCENRAYDYGAVGVSSGDVLIDNCTFESNYANRSIAALALNTKVTVNNTIFKNNRAKYSGTLYYENYNPDEELIIDNSQFIDNDCCGAYLNHYNVKILNSNFKNSVSEDGIAIYNGAINKLYLSNNTVNSYKPQIFSAYGGDITSNVTVTILNNRSVYYHPNETVTIYLNIFDDNDNMIQVQDFDLLVNNTKIDYEINKKSWYQDYEANFTSNKLGLYSVSISNIKLSNLTLKTAEINIVNITDDFSSLQNLIDSCNGTLTLTKNYTYNPLTDYYFFGIGVSKNITIDGAGFTLNGVNQMRILIVESDNVTIKNITIINGDSYAGGAVNWRGNFGLLTNCTFINNRADNGGAVEWEGQNGTITNCIFINNTAYDSGGGIDFDDAVDCEVLGCLFKNNHAMYGGAISAYSGDYLFVFYSEFINNSADYSAGAIYCEDCYNIEISDCSFINNFADKYSGAITLADCDDSLVSYCNFTNNTANRTSGAIEWWGINGEVSNCNFKDNSAPTGGAIYWFDNPNGLISDCNFTNNSATIGGAIYWWGENGTISNCDFINNSAVNGSAIYGYKEDIVISNSNFIANNASEEGGAIYYMGNKLTIDNSIFTNNTANTAGAIKTAANTTINNTKFLDNGKNCIKIESNANITLNNVTSDVQLINDTINMTIIEIKDVVYGNDINIKVQLNSSVISPLNSGKAVVKINGVEYNADVKDGTATIVIPNLDAGSYNVNISYIDHNTTRAEIPVNFNITKKDITINAENTEFIINYDGTYNVEFINVSDDVKVSFILNGKNIGTSIIKNGTASIKLTANILKTTKAGKKNMIIKFEKNNYNPLSKTVEITINKEKTKITAKAKTFKRGMKTKKYSIILKNSKGKAVKKAKVTLKVKGKTYKAKTNKKGKATFKITKLTKKGTQKAVIKYKGNNYYNKINKKIKIKIK